VAAPPPFIALTIAGSDPTGGAGVQGDLKTFAAHGVYGAAVVTAVTVQDSGGVRAVHPVPADVVAAQIGSAATEAPPAAVKTGMLHSPATVEAVAAAIERHGFGNLVVDPVLAASSGGTLAEPGLARAIAGRLAPLAALVTPNREEAGELLGRAVPEGAEEDAAQELLRLLRCGGVLVKGGHGKGPATDVLATSEWLLSFSLPRIATRHGHGTGCALSAAIAARLAKGATLPEAVHGAKDWVHRALAAAVPLGGGRAPVRHDVPADEEEPAPEA
jgi:hydroxymethylpyrimidine/phosphomethylpyrimidine kinase